MAQPVVTLRCFIAILGWPLIWALPAWAGTVEPDLRVSDLPEMKLWGIRDGTAAFSVGTVACNHGGAPLEWQGLTARHPVVAQALYRYDGGRMEQVGMSWLKHGFLALAQDACGLGCQDPGDFTVLGIGCSDPYSAALNGDQSRLGARSEVNAATGAFSVPSPTQPATGNSLFKRLQVKLTDLDDDTHPQARYFAEAQYVSSQEIAAGHGEDSVSYREVSFDLGFNPTMVGPTVQGKAALEAWRALDPTVSILDLDVPGDGRIKLATRVSALTSGRWRYEYALYNQSSHRSARALRIPLAPGTEVTHAGFHDVDYHSGELYDGTDWTLSVTETAVSWATEPETEHAEANALRFGTTYNFWFEADRPPGPATAAVELFRAGAPQSLEAATQGPQEGSTLKLRAERFEVTVSFETAQGASGSGQAVPLTDDSGTFWFFNPANVELVIKVLNGCPVNGHYWVFAAGLTNVEVLITVTDTTSDQLRTYLSPLGQAFQPVQDTGGFATCP